MPVGSGLRPGGEVAGFRLEELLGRGGMGAVYRAEDIRLGRKVALKLLAPELAESERFRERFLRESQLAASLDHPHIVPIYAAGEADGQLYLAMRFVDGYDLRGLLAREAPLAPERALRLLEQVGDALDAAHERGLIHRDVKPGNVLIAVRSGREHCYLADFGLTKQTSSISGLTGTGELVGTVEYVSPEQIRGEPLDGRADVYALGCVLYECLAGEPPFARDSEVATLWAHVNEPPPRLAATRPDLGNDVDRVVARALGKAAAARYESCRELVSAADDALGVSSPSAPLLAPSRRWSRGRLPGGRLGVLTAAAGAVALLAAVVMAVLLLGDPEGLSGLGPRSVGVIDPATNELVGDVPLGFTSSLIAAGAGSVWVVDTQGNTLTRIDANTREIVPPTRGIPVDGVPTGVVVDGESIWVAVTGSTDLVVLEIGSELGDVRREVVLDASARTAYGGDAVLLALADGDVFALEVSQGEVTRIDGATGTAVRLVEGADASSIAAAGGAVWLGGKLGVTKLDAETGVKLARTSVANVVDAETSSIAVGGNAVWFAASSRPRVTRIDPSTVTVLDSFQVGARPSAVAVGEDGAVWVANRGDGTVARLDPEAEDVETVRLGSPPGGIVAAYDRVWTSAGEPVG